MAVIGQNPPLEIYLNRLDNHPDVYRKCWPGMVSLLAGILLPLTASAVSSGNARTAILFVALMCWTSLPLWIGYFVLKTGVLRAGTSVSIRTQEPLRFWIGFVFIGALVLFISAIASMFLWATIFP